MKVAYVDTSCVAALAFSEPGSAALAAELDTFDRLISSNLLEAELRSAFQREGANAGIEDYLKQISWVYPNRPLTRELESLARVGYVRGADLWHLACALFFSPKAHEISFATLDRRQREAAQQAGFAVIPTAI